MACEFIEGNEAIARAGGVVIQAKDEIASMGFCIGAAMAGRKVLTATSGPGISLYSENIGLAIMGEVPMVIVNIQRQGPAPDRPPRAPKATSCSRAGSRRGANRSSPSARQPWRRRTI